MSKYLVSRANALVFGVFVAILAIVGVATWERFQSAAIARAWTEHTYGVLNVVKDLGLALSQAESAQRGYSLTGHDDYLAPYNAAVARVAATQAALQRLTGDNPVQQQRLLTLSPLVTRKLALLDQIERVRREQGLDAVLKAAASGNGRAAMSEIDSVLSAIEGDEQALLAARQQEMDIRSTWVGVLGTAGALIAIAALLLAARMLNKAWRRANSLETEQRVVAQRLRSSLDSLSQGVGVFAADRTLTNWNDCFKELLDLPKAMLRRGTPYAAFADQAAEAGMTLESEDQLSHGRQAPGDAVIYEMTRSDGHHLEMRRTPMPDGGFVLTISDMTKRSQADAVLREVQKMQAIGQLTGGIAHDFNNLLTVILGNLEYVQGKLPDDSVLKVRIERGLWAANRGATLTSQLLAFARKQPLAPAAIDLAATMPQFIPLLRRTLGEHIEVRYVETAGLWPAMADPAQLESAVLNLALNARDAMPGGGRLTIELANKVLDQDYANRHAEVTAGDYTMLAVSDTGHGMTPDIAARVFEPFFTTKPDGRGTGLGLAMVFGFVKQSGGHVKIYSEPGEGTTVRIYLPRSIGAAFPSSQRVGSPIDLPRGSATVLVVEDEPAVREIAVTILGDLGYRVLQAADGEEGLLVFGQHATSIDLLLTDVVLPGKLRGRELAERIAAIRPGIPVLYMSGYTENSIVHHGRLDDGVQLIGKPFKREQLARKIADILGQVGSAKASDSSNVVEFRSGRAE